MSQGEWLVKKAILKDADRWFLFASLVKEDFCGLDLSKDENYRAGMIKNINRGTAIYIEDDLCEDHPIIGAMVFSPNQNNIGWLAVHPSYRRRGLASSLMIYMLHELNTAERIKVKTFRDDDEYGTAARGFYKSHGFIEGEVLLDEAYPHPVQEFTKKIDK
ncbi:MAG TPA: GNAT family N-acetyltransferase [Patescibacteria group bacterium]|nr:GNAT family N-acetyltransferase [Patescibacteria group bacterium]